MNRILKRCPRLTGLALVICSALLLFHLGMPGPMAFALVALWQLSQFVMSKRCGVCFTGVLTPEQVKEFEGIIKELALYKDLFPTLKDLGTVEGGFAAIKQLPDLFKKLGERFKSGEELITQLRKDLDDHRRASLKMKMQIAPRAGQVSVDCARHIAAIAIVSGLKRGQIKGDTFEGIAKDIFGAEFKSALTTSDIPLPVEYSGEVVELVSMFGTARQFGTVFPLGNGTVKLPRLTTDTAFGLISMSGTVTEKSPAFEFVTFAAEKYGGLVRIPSELDEDSIVALGQFIARYSARQLAKVEDKVFWTGNGTTDGDPEGLTISTITNSKVTQMASTKTHYSDATLANLRAVRSVVEAAVLRNAAYYMHPTFEQHLSTLNSAGDRPYNPMVQLSSGGYPVSGNIGPTLDGFPIRWVDIMPAFSTSANVSKVFVLFGDPSYQYLGVRGGIRYDTSTDVFFATDEIAIRALERFTIGLMALGAVSGLETAAS